MKESRKNKRKRIKSNTGNQAGSAIWGLIVAFLYVRQIRVSLFRSEDWGFGTPVFFLFFSLNSRQASISFSDSPDCLLILA